VYCGRKRAACVMCLLAPLVGCQRSTAVGSGSNPPAATAPGIQIDASNVGAFIDADMKIFNEDVLSQAKAGPVQTFPPQPPSPLSGVPVTFAAYNKWLFEVADALSQGTDPSSSPQYASDSNAAFQEIYGYSGEHTQCLNVPTCKDTDWQRAELQGLDLASVGVRIAKGFMNQSEATQTAAADYLRKTYSLKNPQVTSS
jgi:hypothetical protein